MLSSETPTNRLALPHTILTFAAPSAAPPFRTTPMASLIDELEKTYLKPEVPEFNVGDTVRLHVKVREGERERVQVFEGTVIRRRAGGVNENFTVRRISGGVGVERTFLLHSPIVDDIQVVRHGKVRRAKLYYLRDRVGRAARVTERRVKDRRA